MPEVCLHYSSVSFFIISESQRKGVRATLANEKKLFPLVHPQKRIWYIEKMYPGRPLHNIGGLIWIKGEVDVALLEDAIHLFVKKNEALHIQMIETEGSVFQYFEPVSRRKLQMLDFSGNKEPKDTATAWAEKELCKPFILLERSLYEFAIVRASDQLHGYFVKFHHLVSDGWSMQIMTEQIKQFYMKLRRGEAVESDVESGYSDYIVKEQNYLSSARFEKNKRYWLDKFQTVPDSFLHISTNELAGQRKTFWLEKSLSDSIKQYVHENRWSLNTFFLSLVLLYQHKTTQEQDLIIGTPVLNRSGAKEKQVIGMFTSTLPFRITIQRDESTACFLRRVNKELMESYYNQRYPYDLLVQELGLRKKGYDQLFQISVNYYNTKLVGEWEGSPVENEELYCGQQLYSLQIVIKEWSNTGELEVKIDYRTGDYTDEAIEKLFHHLTVLARQVVSSKEGLTVGDLHLLSESERHRLIYQLNETDAYYPKDQFIHQMIAAQALRTPERVAALRGERALTYAELNDLANRLAHRLAAQEIGKSDIVALLFEHSFETLIAILAVLKTGAAYLPIDPVYPAQRIQYLLKDSNVGMLLCNVDIPEEVAYTGKVMRIDRQMLEGLPLAITELPMAISPQDPAYVIYTSGSTGHPKGVLVKHQGLMNYSWWAREAYYREEEDIAALYSSLAFDLTITSLFPPLMSGNTIAIYPAAEEEFILDRIMNENIVTVLKLTPAHLALIKDRDNTNSSIRLLIVGGENLKSAVASDIHRSFGGEAILINEYGPTETVVGCIVHQFDPETDTQGSVAIGRPIANTQVYLLDVNLQLVPEGVIGEIYIAGDGVAAGYRGRPELSGQRFITNPFADDGQGAMYKTDDLAIRLPNGNIEYIGRSDSQIKLKGYRIELGEIENYLMRIEGVREAVVIACSDDNGETTLAAYLAAAHQSGMTPFAVRQALLEMIPAYMVPQYLMVLDRLPMTANGKVDRKALPDPLAEAVSSAQNEGLNERQKILLNVMKDVLQSETVSLQDNFYRLGGDSIKAIQAMSKLNEVGLSLQVKDILSYPVFNELAFTIEQRSPFKEKREPVEGEVLPTPITDWFFTQGLANPHHYNQSVLIRLKRKAPIEQIRLALKDIVRHHDTLRLRLDEPTGRLRYDGLLQEPKQMIPLELVALDGCAGEEKARIIRERSLACKQSMHLVDGPLFRGILFHESMEKDLLLLTAHHLLVDAVSWRILLEDLERLVQAMLDGQPSPLLTATDSYKSWAEALVVYSDNQADGELLFWENMLQAMEMPLKADYAHEVSTNADVAIVHAELSRDDTVNLLTKANETYNTRSSELLVAALALTCKAMSGRHCLTIEMEAHGREPIANDIDLSRTVGWFTSIYPMRLELPDADISEQLKAVKEQLRAVPNQGIGYGMLTLARKLVPNAVRTIRFNYLGEIDDRLGRGLFELADYATGADSADENEFTVLLDLMPYIQDKKLRMSVAYSMRDFNSTTIERFTQRYMEYLQRLIHHCSEKAEIVFTPSDFDMINMSQEELDNLFT